MKEFINNILERYFTRGMLTASAIFYLIMLGFSLLNPGILPSILDHLILIFYLVIVNVIVCTGVYWTSKGKSPTNRSSW